MHPTLAEILENQKSGLLWVSQDGIVRYANGDACSRTGLAAGGKLYDPDLARAVAQAAISRISGAVTAPGRPRAPGEVIPDLNCRIVPGLSKDDAFVFIRDDNSADPNVAFNNLLQIIRSDLREPVQNVLSGLNSLDPEIAHRAGPLMEEVREIGEVLDKLVELAGIWSSGALLASDRIELWSLLQQAWAEVQPQAVKRDIKVRFMAHDELANLATLYGSEPWLRRVFLECLESAIRAARHGSSLLIEHRQLGPRALIVFRDSGVFSGATQGIEMSPLKPNASGRPDPKNASTRLGLQLCRHVLSLHGGQLREEIEEGERQFLIDLPTGAPHRTSDPQIDIAQAQRYASDLAALMARSRRTKA
jgi:hypothetical protein